MSASYLLVVEDHETNRRESTGFRAENDDAAAEVCQREVVFQTQRGVTGRVILYNARHVIIRAYAIRPTIH